MKTLFITTCAPFTGEKLQIQWIAMTSWAYLMEVDVVVLGDDEGASDICAFYDFLHLPDIRTARQQLDIPHDAIMLTDGLRRCGDLATNYDLIVWVNADLVVLQRPSEIFPALMSQYNSCCGLARRWDYPYQYRLSSIREQLENVANNAAAATLHRTCGFDMFFWTPDLFQRQLDILPEFVVDAWATDHYFKRSQQQIGQQLEVSEAFKCYHLNHGQGKQLKDQGWNLAAKHNREQLNIGTPHDVPMPPMWEG